MSATGVPVEDEQDLARATFRADGVRHHGREFGGTIGLDAEAALAEQQRRSAGQHDEPLPAGMGAHLGGIVRRWLGEPPAHDAHGRVALHRPAQAVGAVVHRTDDNIIRRVLDHLVEGGVQGAGQCDELVQRQAALAVLDAAQRGLSEVDALGQFLQGQALCDPQCPDPFAYEAVQRTFSLRHRQDDMSASQMLLNIRPRTTERTRPGARSRAGAPHHRLTFTSPSHFRRPTTARRRDLPCPAQRNR